MKFTLYILARENQEVRKVKISFYETFNKRYKYRISLDEVKNENIRTFVKEVASKLLEMISNGKKATRESLEKIIEVDCYYLLNKKQLETYKEILREKKDKKYIILIPTSLSNEHIPNKLY